MVIFIKILETTFNVINKNIHATSLETGFVTGSISDLTNIVREEQHYRKLTFEGDVKYEQTFVFYVFLVFTKGLK